VIEKTPADRTALPVEREALMHDLKQRKGQERANFLMDSILTNLTAEGKVKVHYPEIQRITASYHSK
jgi:hypothetical protein